MSSHGQRIAYQFGKTYWWDRDPDGLLTLQPTAWINAPRPPRQALAHRRPGTGPVSTPDQR
ncbi:hypothetical protein [Streptomyces drozdowiczii]|uniref:hypothetical protein n=1 Tax=Streptomyces drozdowiczii TaxID=202862 RepID=UPI00403C0765